MSNEFDSARDLLGWSAEDAIEFHDLANLFLDGACYTQLKDIDPDTGDIVLKLRFEPVPSELRKIASHIIWDLKHALDHATCAAIRVITGQDAGNVHFPFASHPNDLEYKLGSVFKNGQSRYPPSLHPIFRKFEPYPTGSGYPGGGNEFIAFSHLANETKHTISLNAGPAAQVTFAKGTGGMKRLWLDNWDAATRELTICHIDPTAGPTEMGFQIAMSIGFSDVKAFEGAHAWDVLSSLGQAIEGIVDELEAEATRLAKP